jgi:hypothetical protein
VETPGAGLEHVLLVVDGNDDLDQLAARPGRRQRLRQWLHAPMVGPTPWDDVGRAWELAGSPVAGESHGLPEVAPDGVRLRRMRGVGSSGAPVTAQAGSRWSLRRGAPLAAQAGAPGGRCCVLDGAGSGGGARSSMRWCDGQPPLGVALKLPAALMHGPVVRSAE